ncbi:MAG: benzoate-CoA ligase family protein [Myxococcales bacterium]|nr:benzoate-CoA ligase family protein [Polyangiaceae bacterium]MDW8247919.1 benzoate-CoA ligase family protein [Myxococcales bacterium]
MSKPVFPEEFNLADYFLLDRLGEGLGEKVAVRFGTLSWTYAQVAHRTERLGAALQAAGVRPEERVLIVLPDTPPFVWSIFAILKIGAVLTMGNPDAPTTDLAYLVGYTRASAIITLPRVATALEDTLRGAPCLRCLLLVPEVLTGHDPETSGELPPTLAGIPSAWLSDALREAPPLCPWTSRRDDVAIWLFTSGSTGKSKAAIHTHRDFAFNTEVYAKKTIGYRPDDVTVSVPRLYFGYATGTNLFFPFAVGATICLFAERPTPDSLYAAIEQYRPTIVTNVPTMLGKLLDWDEERRSRGEPGLDLSSVRFSLSAGEALPASLLSRWLARFGGEVYDGIGSAEMFHIYATNRPGDVRPGSLGKVVEGYEIKVLPQEAEGPGAPPLPPNEIGLLWVKGDSVALAYHQDRDKSWQTFHGHWCCTGDLFRIDEEGYLWFAGRADELLKVSGLWVSPLEVEECLMQHPEVAHAAVIGVLEDGLLKPKAYVVARPEGKARGEALVAELQQYVKERLSKHKYPRWIELVEDLPKNDRGKIDRKALKAREGQP